MIHEVDDSLSRLIDESVGDGGVEVAFDAPTRDWASRQNSPTVSCFLYDIREDLSRRNVGPTIIRDDNGIVVERRQAPRKFKLSYLLTAWTQRPQDEHRLLATLLQTLLQYDKLPTRLLSGSLADLGLPVVLAIALPPSQDRSLSDIWSAFGGELKPSIDLQVIAPLEPARGFEVGPPALEEPRFTIEGADGSVRALRRAPVEDLLEYYGDDETGGDGANGDAAAGGKGSGSKGAKKGKSGKAAAGDQPAETVGGRRRRNLPNSGGDRIQVGTDEKPGRTFEIRPHVPPKDN